MELFRMEHKKLWLQTLWPEEKDALSYNQMITYVDPDRLTGLYERREQALDDFLENSGQTGDEKAYLMGMDEKADKPFDYDWTRVWSLRRSFLRSLRWS